LLISVGGETENESFSKIMVVKGDSGEFNARLKYPVRRITDRKAAIKPTWHSAQLKEDLHVAYSIFYYICIFHIMNQMLRPLNISILCRNSTLNINY
jgi:hypothetical protein